MKVLFVIKALNGPGGGAEKVCVEIANGLREQGIDIEVLSFERPGQPFYTLDPRIQRHNLGLIGAIDSISKIALLKITGAIRAIIRDRKPDIIVGFMHSAYVPVAFAALGIGTPVILSEHTETRHYATRPMQRRLRVLAERCATGRTVPCEAVAVAYRAEGNLPTHVLHNPVDIAAMGKVAEPPHTPQSVILSVGIFRPEKNHIALVHAFALIAAKYPSWRLRLVGDGPKKAEIVQAARSLGVSERIDMPGMSTNLAGEFSAAAFTVLPSDYESFGLVAAESLAAGRPVVGLKDCAGIAEIVDHEETGLLVERGHSLDDLHENLAQAMQRLIEEPGFRDQVADIGPDRVQRFGFPLIIASWISLLRRYVGPVRDGDERLSR